MSNRSPMPLNRCRSLARPAFMRGAQALLGACMDTLFSGGCALCGAARQRSGKVLCADCSALLPATDAARSCPRCAAASPGGGTCGACLARPPAFDTTIAAWRYAFPADRIVQGIKFHARFALARFAAGELARCVDRAIAASGRPAPDLLVPMPLHHTRLAERGFNQALEIARPLARELRLPVATRGVTRIRATAPQTRLDPPARRANLRGAFHCELDLRGRHVAMVDDVMTTGASADALAAELRRAGAERVDHWVIARTPD